MLRMTINSYIEAVLSVHGKQKCDGNDERHRTVSCGQTSFSSSFSSSSLLTLLVATSSTSSTYSDNSVKEAVTLTRKSKPHNEV